MVERAALAAALTLLLGACGGSGDAPATGGELAADTGCLTCHTDRDTQLAPTLVGLAGSEVRLDDGSVVVADGDYIRRSIVDPESQIVEGYRPAMPRFALDDEEVDMLVRYIEELGE